MQLNGKFLKNIRNARAILSAILLFLVGAFFVGLGIYFFMNPSTDEGSNGTVINFVCIGLGAIAIIAAVFIIIRAIKSLRLSKPLTEEEIQENEEKFNIDAPKIDNLKDTKLFFHFGGKLNQSYFADDKNGNRKYECKLVKFNPFGANTFDFTDVEHNYTKRLKIGKTVTSETDGGMPFVGDMLSSRFKIDGVMCWDYLHQRGLEIKHFLEGRTVIRYELAKSGKTIVNIVPANVKDPFNEESRNFLRMGKGCYRLEIIDAKLEDAVTAAFIISKTDMVE